MFYKILFSTLFLFFAVSASNGQQIKKPVSIIFDSDIGPDYDDAGAITILHVMANMERQRY